MNLGGCFTDAGFFSPLSECMVATMELLVDVSISLLTLVNMIMVLHCIGITLKWCKKSNITFEIMNNLE